MGKRLLTAAIGAPLALAAAFLLPPAAFFGLVALVVTAGAFEFVRLVGPRIPGAPLATLLGLVPLAALGVHVLLAPERGGGRGVGLALGGGLAAAAVLGTLVLLSPTPVERALQALGALTFGVLYFAVPIAAIAHLQRLDPWLLVLLLAIVWLGDTMAFLVGSRFGRHRLAPVVSPNKTWEGAVAGLVTGIAATIAWAGWRLGALPLELLALGTLTAAAAQAGDLFESLIKRAAGVKDSGYMLPGHGGFLDRLDALLFAAPLMAAALLLLDSGVVTP